MRNVHLIAACGVGMGSLAGMLKEKGFRVTGSDANVYPPMSTQLESLGIRLAAPSAAENIPPDADLVVVGNAVSRGNPEAQEAVRRGVPTVSMPQAVARFFIGERESIVVAGTHGKTTTTAMVVCALRAAGLSPGFVVGGLVPQLGASADAGTSPVFVAEACEYDRSFLQLKPRRAVITNVDDDHLDVYGDLDGVRRAFAQFAAGVAANGAIVYCADWPGLAEIAASGPARPVSYSAKGAPADWQAREVRVDGGATRFDVYRSVSFALAMSIRVPGRHNVANALAALAVTHDMGLPLPSLAAGISGFGGAARRFQRLGEARGGVVVDDYAHHPTAIRALLDSARERFPGRRLVVLFQPHQIARTRLLFDELAAALARADAVILTDIYAARDATGTAADRDAGPLAEAIRGRGIEVSHAPDLDAAARAALAELKPGDVLLSVGAGDVHQAGTAVFAALRRA